jgi:hypothetical protein
MCCEITGYSHILYDLLEISALCHLTDIPINYCMLMFGWRLIVSRNRAQSVNKEWEESTTHLMFTFLGSSAKTLEFEGIPYPFDRRGQSKTKEGGLVAFDIMY